MVFVLSLMFLFLVYTNPAYLTPALNVDRTIPLVGIAAMAILMIQKTASKQKLQFQWPESYLMLGLIGTAGLSCFTAFAPKVAVGATGDLAKIAVVYFLIINVADTERKIRIATMAMIAGGLFPAIRILQNYTSGNTAGGPEALACSLVMLVPLSIQLARQAQPLAQPFLALISLLYAMAIFASGSAAGIFGLLASLMVMGLRQSTTSSLLWTRALLVGIVLFLGCHWTTATGSATLLNSHAGVQQPIDTVRVVASLVSNHPILGAGLGCSRAGWSTSAGTETECSSLVTHNTFVQALNEVGVLGFIPFALLIVTALVRSHRICSSRVCNQSAASTTLGLEGALVGFLVYGMFGNYLVSWSPYIVLGLASALSLVLESQIAAAEFVPQPATTSSTCSPAVLETA